MRDPVSMAPFRLIAAIICETAPLVIPPGRPGAARSSQLDRRQKPHAPRRMEGQFILYWRQEAFKLLASLRSQLAKNDPAPGTWPFME